MTAPAEVLTDAEIEPAQLALTAAYVQNTTILRTWMGSQVAALWAGLGDWRSAAVPDFLAGMLPLMAAGREHMANLTATHLAGQIEVARDRRLGLAPTDLAFDPAELNLRGITPATQWRRPFQTTWTELAGGKPLDVALLAGGRRAEVLAQTDLQLVKTHTAREVLTAEPSVVGYRRVLSGSQSCARCVLTTTQRYHKADLLPIHPACDCGVEPIIGTHDPGRVIDAELAASVHDLVRQDLGEHYVDAGGRGPIDYRDLIVTHEHGELGPVLTIRGQDFTGPGDLH